MGFFNFNRAGNRAGQQAGNSAENRATATGESRSAWDKLRGKGSATEQFATDQAALEQQKIAEKQRQERKAIDMVLRGDSAITGTGQNIGDRERTVAFEKINSGAFGKAEQSAILKHIAPPSKARGSSAEQVFQQMDSLHNRRILAYVNDLPGDQDGLRQISSQQITATLERFPTPVEFAAVAERLLENIRANNPPDKYQEYVQDMEKFKHQVYGKRQEYYEAFQSLEAQAAKYATKQAKRAQVLNAIHPERAQRTQTFNVASSDEAKVSEAQYLDRPKAGEIQYPKEDQGYLSPEMQEVWRAPAEIAAKSDSAQNPSQQGVNSYDIDTAAHNAVKSPEAAPRQPVEVYRVDKREAKKFLKAGKIEGDTYLQDGQEYQLTPDYLEKMGLAPEYKFKADGKTEIATSKIYRAGNHDAVIAYVRTPKGTKVVSYYRSNSQGTWRYLPDYVSDGHDVKWLGKGMDEESLNLPTISQEALAIIDSQPHLQNNQLHDKFVFAGTAKRYNDRNSYLQAMRQNTLRGDHYQEVAPTAAFSFGKISRDKHAPETLDVTDGAAPDFGQLEAKFTFNSGTYGRVAAEQYVSTDGQLVWTFNRDRAGRAWVGGIEVQSPLSSAGLHTKWAQAGDYGTPLYDYETQDGSYGDPSDRRGERYISMWTNYLSRMPIIKKYLAHKQRSTASQLPASATR